MASGLMSRFAGGDAVAVRKLYSCYGRVVFTVAFSSGLTHKETAQTLEMPVGTVKSSSHRAHRRLAALLSHLETATA